MTGGTKRKHLRINPDKVMTTLLSLLTEDQKKRYSIKIENYVWHHAFEHRGQRSKSNWYLFVSYNGNENEDAISFNTSTVEELIEKFKIYINGSDADRSKENA
jgi:subtilisin-like proprotein convertase family protein